MVQFYLVHGGNIGIYQRHGRLKDRPNHDRMILLQQLPEVFNDGYDDLVRQNCTFVVYLQILGQAQDYK